MLKKITQAIQNNKDKITLILKDDCIKAELLLELKQKIDIEISYINIPETQSIDYLDPHNKYLLIFDNFAADNRFENIWLRYNIEKFDAQIVVLCNGELLKNYLDPSLYFVSIKNNKLQKNQLIKYELPASTNKSISKQSSLFSKKTIEIKREPKVFTLRDHFLNQKLMTQDIVMMQMLADRAQESVAYQQFLFSFVFASTQAANMQYGAANTITGLNSARVSFSNMDLSAVKIMGAQLRGMTGAKVKFNHADLDDVNLESAYLPESEFDNTKLTNVRFGETPDLIWPTGSVTKVSFSPEKYKLFAAGDPNCILVYDIRTGAILKNFSNHKSRILSFDLSPIEQYLVTTAEDKTIIFWDIPTGYYQIIEDFSEIKIPDWRSFQYLPVIFTPNGKSLIYATLLGYSESHIIYLAHITVTSLRQVEITKEKITEGYGAVTKIELSKNSQWLAWTAKHSYYDSEIILWDFPKRSFVKKLKGYWFCLSPDATLLAILTFTAKEEEVIEVYRLADFHLINTFPGHSTATHLESRIQLLDKTFMTQSVQGVSSRGSTRDLLFIPDENGRFTILASSGDDAKIILWNIHEIEPINTLLGHSAPVTSLTLSPDGKLLVSATGNLRLKGGNISDCAIKFWDINKFLKKQPLEANHLGKVNGIVLRKNDGLFLTSSQDGTIKAWTRKHGTLLKSFVPFSELTFQGQQIVSLDIISLHKTQNGETYQLLAINKRGQSKIFAVSGTAMREIGSIDFKLKKNENIFKITVSPDKTRLAYRTSDGIVVIMNLETRQEIFSKKIEAVSLIFCEKNNGELLALSGLNMLLVLNGWTGEIIFEYHAEQNNPHCAMEPIFLPDNNRILISAENNYDKAMGQRTGNIVIWDISKKERIKELLGHDFPIHVLAICPETPYLFSADWSGKVIVWDIQKQVQLHQFSIYSSEKGISEIQFVNKNYLLILLQNHTIQYWEINYENIVNTKLIWHTPDKIVLAKAIFSGITTISNKNKMILKNAEAIFADDIESALSYFKLAEIMFEEKHKIQEAIKYLELAIQLKPKFAEAYLLRGRCEIALKNYSSAEQYFNIADKMSGNDFFYRELNYHFALLYLEIDDIDRAYKFLKQAMKSSFIANTETLKIITEKIQKLFPVIKEKRRLEKLFLSLNSSKDSAFYRLFTDADVNKQFKDGLTLLDMAICRDNFTTANYLLRLNADPIIKNKSQGFNTLRIAVLQYYQKKTKFPEKLYQLMLKIIDKNPACLNGFDNEGYTPFHAILAFGDTDFAGYCLKKGANIDARILGKSSTPLMQAVIKFDIPIIRFLLENGADYTLASLMGSTIVTLVSGKVTNLLLKRDFGDIESLLHLPEYLKEEAKKLRIINKLLIDQYLKDNKILPEGMDITQSLLDKLLPSDQPILPMNNLINATVDESLDPEYLTKKYQQISKDNIDAALKSYREGMLKYPSCGMLHEKLAYCYWMKGLLTKDKSMLSKAGERFKIALQKKEENAHLFVLYGLYQFRYQRYADATVNFEKVIIILQLKEANKKIKFDDFNDRILIAELQAEVKAVGSIEFHPKILSYYFLIKSCIAMNETDKANKWLNKFVEHINLDIENALVYSLVGYCYKALLKYNQAGVYFAQASELQENYVLAEKNSQECFQLEENIANEKILGVTADDNDELTEAIALSLSNQ